MVVSIFLRNAHIFLPLLCKWHHIVHAVLHLAFYHFMSWCDSTLLHLEFSPFWQMANLHCDVLTVPQECQIPLGDANGTPSGWSSRTELGTQQVLSKWEQKRLIHLGAPNSGPRPIDLDPETSLETLLYSEMVTFDSQRDFWVRLRAESLFVSRQVGDTQEVLFF